MQDTSATSWWNSGWSSRRNEREIESLEEEKALHRKRLAAILRYIASMHQGSSSSGGDSSHRFVRRIEEEEDNESRGEDFFQCESNSEDENRVLFSTNDFRKLISVEALEGDSSRGDKDHPPFSFYAPKSSVPNDRDTAAKKSSSGMYGLSSVFSSSKSPRGGNGNEKGLWLRLKRLGPSSVMQQPNYDHPLLKSYLNDWLNESSKQSSVEDLLTIGNLDRAPSINNSSLREQRFIKNFIRRYRTYLRTKLYQQTLEPIYNSLFEWNQQQNENNEEIIWGLGHAKMLSNDGRMINGPLLEVLVEVELAPDGALLIRPREHTGVNLNREVVAAIVASGDASSQHILSKFHRAVGEMETSVLSPGQPRTYVPFLKKIALELSPGGTFQASADTNSSVATVSPGKKSKMGTVDFSKLQVSEAWCLYVRSKPSSVWARDANLVADKVANHGEIFPIATWSLTHGSSKLECMIQQNSGEEGHSNVTTKKGNITSWVQDNFGSPRSSTMDAPNQSNSNSDAVGTSKRPIFPLATSESQDRIANLLLRQNYPAVIAEGPPGTGKTHTIANIVSAYLCEGKRVLVTSKNANALSVLRGRLPQSVRELVVDVSMSETQGMRQLQQTVERLAIRVSVASTDIEAEKCSLLQRSIDNLDIKLQEIDEEMSSQSERVRQLLQLPNGITMIEKLSELISSAPWLTRSIPKMSLKNLKVLANDLKALLLDPDDSIFSVTGFNKPPSRGLISFASAKSGSSLSSLSQITKNALASLPIFGPAMDDYNRKISEEVNEIDMNGSRPESKDDWYTVTKALNHSFAVHTFEESIWGPLIKENKWPQMSFRNQDVVKNLDSLLQSAIEVKELQILLDAENAMKAITESRKHDIVRTRLSDQKRHHSEELADAAVVAELSRSFSPDAQSALIKFAQIAGAAKFSRSAKPSKMSQRQRRRRQEYLSAFDRCCRFIPCWILTTSQISDYLPAECLFDLVVIDESSQSDVTVLPGMMRGKQWLIVGDGKQVSPTEAFVSEEHMNNLRATLPDSPLEDALLPGRSFFDMCAQSFPRGRVVLHEHFRCAPEIIKFSNEHFYGGRLTPLRLPTKRDRFVPSILDVRVTGGMKEGKVNEKEADKIVEMVREIMINSSGSKSKPRSIGIISLIGDEQSRLVRGRLLDSCGPEFMARHNVLVGDPPHFQGAERDIVFLSMVCSRENCPTQNQQFHFQRANVALSRARDKIVLVRSIDLMNIPSPEDVKIPIIEFFMSANDTPKDDVASENDERELSSLHRKTYYGKEILETFLVEKGYQTHDMSTIWKNAFCVEHEISDTRAAILVDCEEPQQSDWLHSYTQQKGIERVGWQCLRVDCLSLFVDYDVVVQRVIQFLTSHGITEPVFLDQNSDRQGQKCVINLEPTDAEITNSKSVEVVEIDDEDEDEDEITALCSEEDKIPVNGEVDDIKPDQTKSSRGFTTDDSFEASKYGEVADLNFLRATNSDSHDESISPEDDFATEIETMDDHVDRQENNELKRPSDDYSDERDTYSAQLNNSSDDANNETINETDTSNPKLRSQKRRKMSKYSRDGTWFPHKENGGNVSDYENDNGDWYDTDLDIRNNNGDNDEEKEEGKSTN